MIDQLAEYQTRREEYSQPAAAATRKMPRICSSLQQIHYDSISNAENLLIYLLLFIIHLFYFIF